MRLARLRISSEDTDMVWLMHAALVVAILVRRTLKSERTFAGVWRQGEPFVLEDQD